LRTSVIMYREQGVSSNIR